MYVIEVLKSILILDMKKRGANYFSTNLNLIYSNENAKTHSFGKTIPKDTQI